MTRSAIAMLLACMLTLAPTLPTAEVSQAFAQTAEAAPNAAEPAQQRVVKVGYINLKGMIERNDDGSFSGYAYDYLVHVAQYTGWTYEFVEAQGETENERALALLDMLDTGEVDLEGNMVYSEQLAELYEYPQNSYGTAHTALFAPSNGALTQTNLATRGTLRVALYQSAKQRREELEYFCSQNKLKLETVECTSLEEMQDLALSGEADALLDVDVNVHDGFDMVAWFAARPYFFAAPHGQREIIDELDATIARINESDPTLQNTLRSKYFMESNENYALTEDELAFAQNHRSLRVGVLSDKQPVQSIDPATGELKGVTRGVLDYLSDMAGLEFEIVPLERSDDMAAAIKAADVDMVAGIDANYSVSESLDLSLSAPYLTASTLIVYNKFINPDEFPTKKLAVPWELSSLAKNRDNIAVYDTIEACLEAVNNGEADYTYANTYTAPYYTSIGNLGNVLTLPQSTITSTTAFGFVRPVEPELLLVVDKLLRGLPAEQRDSIMYDNALIDQSEQVNLFLQDHLLEIAAGCITLLMVVIVLLALYLRTRTRAGRRMREENRRFQKLYGLTNEQLFEYSMENDTLILSNPKGPEAIAEIPASEQSDDGSYRVLHHAHAQIAVNSDPEMLDAFTSPNRLVTDLPYHFANGDEGWLRIISNLVTNDEGRPISVIGKVVRIDDEVRERMDLSKRAHHDGLTGLLNWETFKERAGELLAAGKAGALLIIDADNFKGVNDTYGHLAGDGALRQTAEALRRAFRPNDLVGRLGGDEFAVCLNGPIDHDQLVERCARIVGEGVAYVDQADVEHSITLSIGGVELKDEPISYRNAYQQADSALYRAKEEGKDRFVLEKVARK
ncbi:GGDEF domain-containing protein [Gordonibacter massiliensis (ex Traore et al. 2017)]|nr:GGDEF domain-containing protein [Gordonibacter massiliensis (ex Traore et al. 2017)]